jgi:transcriptional regulator with XRE-family HTH domain
VTRRSSALGEALRAWRGRVTPAAAGLPTGADRRVPGLRREELASLAGLSVDYLVRLEQGRASNPSSQTVGALARALRLTNDERDLLHRIAGCAAPPAGIVPEHVPPGVQRLTDRLADTPVGVFTAAWTIVQWNDMWAALQGDPSDWRGRDRNMVWRHFTGACSRVLHDSAENTAFEREIVADLRLATARYPGDPELTAMVHDLTARSPRFAELWDRFEVGPTVSAHKIVQHPDIGPITLDCEVLAVAGSDLKMIVYTAEPDTPDAAHLNLLRVIGVQRLAD